MRAAYVIVFASLVGTAFGAITAQQNYDPVSITVNQAPFDILATPITPDAPYSQAAYQCNVTGDSRYPVGGTFPLNVSVPVGQRVRVIFANGNLGGATVTQQGEPGVIVQQGGSPIVQQAGGASPIVQNVGSPVVQQNAPPAALVVQQTPTVVQQPTYPQAPAVPASPIVQQPTSPSTPATTPATTPAATTAPTTTPASTPKPTTPPTASPPPPTPAATQSPPKAPSSPPPAASSPPPAPVSTPPAPTTTPTPVLVQGPSGRKLLQDTVPGGPNNGLVEYVALASANTVAGFYAGSTQFGVPYVEFTASDAVRGQVASFRGVLEVAQVVGGVPQYPFVPNPSLSPECQVNVNFMVA